MAPAALDLSSQEGPCREMPALLRCRGASDAGASCSQVCGRHRGAVSHPGTPQAPQSTHFQTPGLLGSLSRSCL